MRHLFAATIFAFALAINPAQAKPVKYTIDKLHTWITFKLIHLGYANTMGTFGKVTGTVMFDQSNALDSSVNASIDTKSVRTGFDKRDAWITSDKVLNTDKFPTITFASKSIKVSGKNTGTIVGNLTINGISKPVELKATFNKIGVNPLTKNETIGISATTQFKRSEFGIKAFVGPLGDLVTVDIELEAIRAK